MSRPEETMSPVRLAVVGAGLIGLRHIEEITAHPQTSLSAIVDPSPAAAEVATTYGVPLFTTLTDLFARDKPDGVILATPNTLHAEGGLECIAAGVPVIVEKPIADSVEAAERLVEAGERAGVPVLTGHHRNYSLIMSRSREIIASGVLGRLVVVIGSALFYKPDDYFDVGDGWRRKPGGGPILLNLIHEINNLVSLVGPIVRVQATSSNAARGFPVEDTAVMTLTFANGVLGTFALSDSAASARSWEQTSKENTAFASYDDEDCYHVAGTQGSLSIPTLRLKVHTGPPSWWSRCETSTADIERSDPLVNQITHFVDVIRNGATPVCSGRDGLDTLRIVNAVVEAARTGQPVDLPAPAVG